MTHVQLAIQFTHAIAFHHAYANFSITFTEGILLLDSYFGQYSNCFRHLRNAFEVKVTNNELVSFCAAFSSDAIGEELYGLICVPRLINKLYVKQTS